MASIQGKHTGKWCATHHGMLRAALTALPAAPAASFAYSGLSLYSSLLCARHGSTGLTGRVTAGRACRMHAMVWGARAVGRSSHSISTSSSCSKSKRKYVGRCGRHQSAVYQAALSTRNGNAMLQVFSFKISGSVGAGNLCLTTAMH